MQSPINRVVIYSKDVAKMAAFYEKHFGFEAKVTPNDRIIELVPADGGISLMLHPAGKGTKAGQVIIKLVFDVADVAAFRNKCALNGLKFGVIHQADGYVYANAKDTGKNSIQISSRAFK